jgi:oxygen-independent coproporphyrinogen-3 oxidase
MDEKGYLHYEISNYCLPGQFARHNTAYWKGETYLGLGPSAHSYNGTSRQWNVSAIKEYLEAINRSSIPSESEELSLEQTYNEYVMTGLRTMWGCNSGDIRQRFGSVYSDYFSENAVPWINSGRMEKSGDVYTPYAEREIAGRRHRIGFVLSQQQIVIRLNSLPSVPPHIFRLPLIFGSLWAIGITDW